MEIYLVGGAVRDRCLGVTARDKDYVVLGTDRETFLQRFPHACEVGKRTRVYYIGGDEYTLSTARTIEEDLLGRDLTINAMAMDGQGEIIAHPQAREHLAEKILCPVARGSFLADPVRVYRVARFAACMPDFSVHPRVITQMQEVAARSLTDDLSAERVGNELIKTLSSALPSRFLDVLDKGGCFHPWFKELDTASSIPAGPFPFHDESVLEHIGAVMDALAGNPEDVWMGFCHDLGKVSTDPEKWPCHHGHEFMSETHAQELGLRLRLPAKIIAAGRIGARWHMTAGRYQNLRPGTRVDLLTQVGETLLQGLCALVRADSGKDMYPLMKHDWKLIQQVRLPEQWQNKGARSGEHLRMLRAQSLAGD